MSLSTELPVVGHYYVGVLSGIPLAPLSSDFSAVGIQSLLVDMLAVVCVQAR